MPPILNSLGGAAARAFGFTSGGGVLVPAGLIVPLADTVVPSGWTAFTDANDKFIVGAGSTYAGGETGGNASFSVSGSLSNTGGHTGPGTQTNSGSSGGMGSTTAGAHSHNFSGSVADAIDEYKEFILIKADSDTPKLPSNAVLFGVSDLDDLTNIETTTDAFIRGSNTFGPTGGGSSFNFNASSSNTGGHEHGNYGRGTLQNNFRGDGDPRGAHSHSFSGSGTLNTKRFYVSAWTDAAEEFDLVGNGIAMWESATAPQGWNICDGTNGTPDMRDYFLRLGNTGNHGTSAGDNLSSWSASFTQDASHTHITGTNGEDSVSYRPHGSYSWSHTHNTSGSTAVVQPYYSLYFVQLAA